MYSRPLSVVLRVSPAFEVLTNSLKVYAVQPKPSYARLTKIQNFEAISTSPVIISWERLDISAL